MVSGFKSVSPAYKSADSVEKQHRSEKFSQNVTGTRFFHLWICEPQRRSDLNVSVSRGVKPGQESDP